ARSTSRARVARYDFRANSRARFQDAAHQQPRSSGHPKAFGRVLIMILAQFTGVWIVIVAVDGVSGQKRAPLALVAADACSDAIIEMDLRRRQGDVCPPYPICAQTLLVTIDGQ